MLSSNPICPVIIGIPGTTLDDQTRADIARLNPAGFILFKRNCESREQLEALCAELRALSPLATPLIFIDQEGGRINRILWEPYTGPAGAKIGALYHNNPEQGLRAAELNGYLIAAQLAVYGITVDCLPVADIRQEGAHDVIGDRAFSHDPAVVSALCAATIKGMLAGGVYPVIKHAPGHGRAKADSHFNLPVVDTNEATLMATDFLPFQQNNRCPFVMTAHITYTALDSECATRSHKVIEGIMRQKLGMTGLMVSDDLFMKALPGPLLSDAQAALQAGCDMLLVCNTQSSGAFSADNWQQMMTLTALPGLRTESLQRLAALPALHTPQPDTLHDAFHTLQAMLAA